MKHQKARKNKIAVILAATVILAAAVLLLLLTPRFQISAKEVTVEAGKTFHPESYLTKLHNVQKDKIKISGAVDCKKPGKYTVSYSYKKKTKTLSVLVEDTVLPEIAVKENLVFQQGEAVTADALATVSDATACALTLDAGAEDLAAIGTHTVTVVATDAGKNVSKCEVTFEIQNPDHTPPTISGIGNITVTRGAAFDARKGVTVRDDYDENPMWTVDENGLDLNKTGTYTVIYTVTDSAGNTATATREVTVVAPKTDPPVTGNGKFNASGVANQPYLVAVNRSHCTVTVYKKDGDGNYTVPVKAMACSVGRAGHETPTGRFNTTNRYEWRLMVDNSYGRYAIRIKGSIMFHSVCYYSKNEADLEYEEYNKLGSPASLGCIRLCLADIKWIYDNCPTGFPAVIYDDPDSPGPLGKPSSIKIDGNDVEKRGYDPTDWSPNSPWNR